MAARRPSLARRAAGEAVDPEERLELVVDEVVTAIRELEQAGVRAAFLNAIQAAMERGRELAAGEE